jgi:tRNA(Arg) A34 adenosine deaminase TadA
MRVAIDEARIALDEGEMPYGAVIADADGTIVVRTHDMVDGTGDPTRHAEFDAVRLAVAVRGPDLTGCMVVSTVEPCCMCSGAAWYAGITTAVFGLSMRETLDLAPDAMEEAFGPVDELYAGMRRKVTAVHGVLREECAAQWAAYLTR